MNRHEQHPKISARLYVAADLPSSGDLALDRDQTHYLATVMRAKVGAQIGLFNGRDGEWIGEIIEISRKSVTLRLTGQLQKQAPGPDVMLMFAPIKKARLDFIAQKATELGVSHLQPVLTDYTNADRIKIERLKANAIEAAEQCERITVPICSELKPLSDLLHDWPDDRHLVFCDEDMSGLPVHQALKPFEGAQSSKWAILIGPEGGFSPAEREKIRSMKNAIPVSLGPRVLRADTAAIAAITLWQATLGDWA